MLLTKEVGTIYTFSAQKSTLISKQLSWEKFVIGMKLTMSVSFNLDKLIDCHNNLNNLLWWTYYCCIFPIKEDKNLIQNEI